MARGNERAHSGRDEAEQVELGDNEPRHDARGHMRSENASKEHTRAKVWLRGQAAVSKAQHRRGS